VSGMARRARCRAPASLRCIGAAPAAECVRAPASYPPRSAQPSRPAGPIGTARTIGRGELPQLGWPEFQSAIRSHYQINQRPSHDVLFRQPLIGVLS
jgi:hypothetical protein